MEDYPSGKRWRPGDFAGVGAAPIPQAQRNAYLPPGGFQSWNTALAAAIAGKGVATAWWMGGSIAAGGSVVANVISDAYPAIWAKSLLARTGAARHGDTFFPMMSAAWNATANMPQAPFVMDLAATSWFPIGSFYSPLYVATGVTLATPQFHYRHPSTALGYRARSFRVFYWSFGNQDGGAAAGVNTFQWNLNGGAAQTVNLTATQDNFIKSFDVTSATPGWSDTNDQVINFGNQSAAVSMAIIAVASYPGPLGPGLSGVHFGWAAANGFFCLGDLGDKSGQYPSDKPARVIAPIGAVAPYVPNPAMSPPFAPDLVLIDAFDDLLFPNQNGATASVPVFTNKFLAADAYDHVLRQFVQAFRRKPSGCDFVHMMPNFPTGVVSDSNPPGANFHLDNAWLYYEKMWALAQFNGHGWLNTDNEWRELAATGFGSVFLSGTNPHPTLAGMQDIASRMSSRLGL